MNKKLILIALSFILGAVSVLFVMRYKSNSSVVGPPFSVEEITYTALGNFIKKDKISKLSGWKISQFEAKDMDRFHLSEGVYAEGGWLITSNGSISKEIDFQGGETKIEVIAWGIPCKDIWPHMVLSIDGKVVAEGVVDSGYWKKYSFLTTLQKGKATISIGLTNYSPPLGDSIGRLLGVKTVTVLERNFKKFTGRKELNNSRIILVGIDGATWEIIIPMLEEGRLPNIAKLVKEGVCGNLTSISPTYSPVIWTGIATGKERNKHGIINFLQKLVGKYSPLTPASTQRKTGAIWNILSAFGNKVAMINWYATWPVEEINGFMVSRRYIEGEVDLPKAVYPENLSGTEEFKSLIRDGQGGLIKEVDKKALNVSDYLLKNFDLDFTAVYFETIDDLSHHYWKYLPPEMAGYNFSVGEKHRREKGQTILEYYEYMDEAIGKLMQHMDENTTFMIVSDHGFSPYPYEEGWFKININHLLEKMDLLKYKDDTTEIDWAKTIAFGDAPGYINFANIYINLKGREADGIIAQRDYEKVRHSLRKDLLEVKTSTGRRIFNDVIIVDMPQSSLLEHDSLRKFKHSKRRQGFHFW